MISNIVLGLIIFHSLQAAPVWKGKPPQECPQIKPVTHLHKHQELGAWRVAAAFLDQKNENLDEDFTCVVMDMLATQNSTLAISLFIDTIHEEGVGIERSTISFSAKFQSPSFWVINTPFAKNETINARVIHSTEDEMIVTFCADRNIEQQPINTKSYDVEDGINQFRSDSQSSIEQSINWKSLFEDFHRSKRSTTSNELHLWTLILVKHNNIKALKFLEYALELSKYGFDVTNGELISFGQCPATIAKKPPLSQQSNNAYL